MSHRAGPIKGKPAHLPSLLLEEMVYAVKQIVHLDLQFLVQSRCVAIENGILAFAKSDMHCIAEVLAYLFANILPDADDIARRSHLHNLAVVGHTVKSGMHQQSAFAEHRLNVERYLHVGGIHVLVLQDFRIEFEYAGFLGVHFFFKLF